MLSEKLRECGVVGAGGAGFPTYVKRSLGLEYVIANGAELRAASSIRTPSS